jgi:glutamate--cysteine ligase
MTTVFPEVRLKNYIEIRNCDCQRADMILALPALIKGIMYNEAAMNQAWDLVKDFGWQGIEELRHSVPKLGLETTIKEIKIADIAKELVNIAWFSLLANPKTADESIYLEKLKELVEEEKTPADIILKNWTSGWDKSIEKLIEYSKLS